MLRIIGLLIFLCNFSFASEVRNDFSYTPERNTNIKSIQAELKALASNVFYITKFTNILNLNYDTVLENIRKTEFLCARNIEVDGVLKDAANFPSRIPQLIVLNCDKWISALTEKQKKILVIHEFLPILGFEDMDYSKSSSILRIHENYKASKVSFLKTPLKELNHNLFMAVWDCDLHKFENVVNLGADIFNDAKKDSVSLLNQSVEQGCFEVAEKLLKYNLDIKRDKDKLSLFMGIALDLNVKFKSFNDKKKFITSFLKFYPGAISDTIDVRNSLYFNSEVDDFGISDLCYFKSNVLHFWASGVRDFNISKDLVLKNYEFFKELGVSISQRNICGDTPGFRKNN